MTMLNSSFRAILVTAIWFPLTGTAVVNADSMLTDGDFDDLTVGTAPDNDVPAGAWHIFTSPLASHQFEDHADQLSVVETSSFDPASTGNSLRWKRTPGHQATQLRNLLNETIEESPNEIVRATFDVFVPDSGENDQGGFSVYLGGDNGGDGIRTTTDRGPSVSWDIRGRLQTNECGANNGAGPCQQRRPVTRLNSTPVDVWQHVQLDIDLAGDSYDLFWSAGEEPLELVSPYNGFRSGEQDYLDRITIAGFRSVPADGDAYIDNIRIEVLTKDWIGDANLDGIFDSGDFVEVFQAGKYETGEVAAWSQGDWNGDRLFDSGDFVVAFQDGGYEKGRKAAVAAVPEPATGMMIVPILLGILGIARRHTS